MDRYSKIILLLLVSLFLISVPSNIRPEETREKLNLPMPDYTENERLVTEIAKLIGVKPVINDGQYRMTIAGENGQTYDIWLMIYKSLEFINKRLKNKPEKTLSTRWKTKLGHYYIELSPMNERPFAFGLREDGTVVWKYTDENDPSPMAP